MRTLRKQSAVKRGGHVRLVAQNILTVDQAPDTTNGVSRPQRLQERPHHIQHPGQLSLPNLHPPAQRPSLQRANLPWSADKSSRHSTLRSAGPRASGGREREGDSVRASRREWNFSRSPRPRVTLPALSSHLCNCTFRPDRVALRGHVCFAQQTRGLSPTSEVNVC